jgi:hypothetical protein
MSKQYLEIKNFHVKDISFSIFYFVIKKQFDFYLLGSLCVNIIFFYKYFFYVESPLKLVLYKNQFVMYFYFNLYNFQK